jgi:Sulfate permease family
MPADSFPAEHDPKIGSLRAGLRDLSAGAICSVLTVAYSLSYATLIFSGPLSEWLGYGIAVSLLSPSIGALVIGLRSSLPLAIAGPDASTSAVLAALVAKLVHDLVAAGATEHLLQHAIIGMALATALTGTVLLLLGVTHAGRAIRFVPYPVIGGFLRSHRLDNHRWRCASDDRPTHHRRYGGRAAQRIGRCESCWQAWRSRLRCFLEGSGCRGLSHCRAYC